MVVLVGLADNLGEIGKKKKHNSKIFRMAEGFLESYCKVKAAECSTRKLFFGDVKFWMSIMLKLEELNAHIPV